MLRIHKLAPDEIQRIAAGEVVERPANAVKELLENALDAGATQITIHIGNGGKDLIRITDNGWGMSPADARMAIEHHATSKITSVHDLKSLATFGFRGEALSSICAVSKTTIMTKEADALQGTHLVIEGSVVTDETITSCATGTDITVQDLFYNVPARKKFLKKRDTEWHQIQQLLQAYALVYKHISFKVFHDDTLTLNCPATDSLITRITQLWDHNFAQHMLAVQAHDARAQLTLTGAISAHSYSRYDRSALFFFVNKRWIKNYALAKAVLKGYMNVLPAGKFPAAIIALEIPQEQVDINIHPRKEEVQFLHPRVVEILIQETVKARFEEGLSERLGGVVKMNTSDLNASSSLAKLATFSTNGGEIRLSGNKNSHNFQQISPSVQAQISAIKTSAFPISVRPEGSLNEVEGELEGFPINSTNLTQAKILPPPQPTPSPFISTDPPEPCTKAGNILGQFNKTYILLEQEDGLFMIDQHAAHERVLYELFAHRFADVATIKLLFPHIVTLNQEDLKILEPHLDIFIRNGIHIELFGATQVIVQALPVHLKDQSLDDLIHQVLGWIYEHQSLEADLFLKQINEKLHAQMACKAAVKAGDVLTHEQMQQLLTDLYATNNRFTCPHGRPTGWLLNTSEIEKKFKRNYPGSRTI
jgi:DNA mismatch repair protein MutL